MAQPKSNYEFFIRYASTLSGSAKFGNLSYQDRVGYSYAQPVVNRLPNVLLMTNLRWSNTTADHLRIYEASLAARQGVPAYVLEMRYPCDYTHAANYEYHTTMAADALDKMSQPRIRNTTKQGYLMETLEFVARYESLCHLFGADRNRYSMEIYDRVKTSLGRNEQLLVIHSEAVLNGYKTPVPYKGEL